MTLGTGAPHSTWSSPLAAALQRFLEGKRAAGYRYRAEPRRWAYSTVSSAKPSRRPTP